mmetsp:Transcript_17500/g.27048  ORF Transcript_17500/g.27048 Transcript_17500/m.27048 type:complete len:210 (+) Transcript_17500:491-1120(+)
MPSTAASTRSACSSMASWCSTAFPPTFRLSSMSRPSTRSSIPTACAPSAPRESLSWPALVLRSAASGSWSGEGRQRQGGGGGARSSSTPRTTSKCRAWLSTGMGACWRRRRRRGRWCACGRPRRRTRQCSSKSCAEALSTPTSSRSPSAPSRSWCRVRATRGPCTSSRSTTPATRLRPPPTASLPTSSPKSRLASGVSRASTSEHRARL